MARRVSKRLESTRDRARQVEILVTFELVGTSRIMVHAGDREPIEYVDGWPAAHRHYRDLVASCSPIERIVATWIGVEPPADAAPETKKAPPAVKPAGPSRSKRKPDGGAG